MLPWHGRGRGSIPRRSIKFIFCMTPLVSAVNQILSIITIIGQAIIVSFFVFMIFYKKSFARVKIVFTAHGILFVFIIACIATCGSLFFSEIAKFDPCKLCWFQRIFMYPQAILFAIAFWKKDKNIFQYSIPLSIIGACIAAYHYSIQISAIPSLFCTAGSPESCVEKPFMMYGYISIPMMSLTAFLLILMTGAVVKVYDKKEN
jgi:disulfide bond formation protein DsbB